MKIRSIRPEFFADPTMAELEPMVRLLYIGLWCYVDDDGRGEWLPKQIDGQVFPLESVDIHALLAQLVSTARIVRYSDGDRDYFHIPTFTEYQKPNRKYDSKLPDPANCTELPGQSALTLSEQRARTAPAHAVEGEGEGEGAAAYDSPEFRAFLADRAAAEVQRRQAAGIPVKNPGGLKRTIANDADFLADAQRIWAHRNCHTCKGKGSTDVWSPGGGMVQVPCEEPT